MFCSCEASNGAHYDIASDQTNIGFCPLAQIDSAGDRSWAVFFIELLFQLRAHKEPTLEQRTEIASAISLMARDTTEVKDRTITAFCATVQNPEIRQALEFYTIEKNAIGNILDADFDSLALDMDKRFFVFEMSKLVQLGDDACVPIMMYIFRQIEKRVSKASPTLIPIDEAFRTFGHPLAQKKMAEWLELMRKYNAAVGFATQNIEVALKLPIASTILQAISSTILLPNPEATSQEIAPLYARLGLNQRERENLSMAVKKRDYYLTNSDGKRMFSLSLGKVALSFFGAAGEDIAKKIRGLMEIHGDKWVPAWLQLNGVHESWFKYWNELNITLKHN
jgi:type IV secretion system protein VirB4